MNAIKIIKHRCQSCRTKKKALRDLSGQIQFCVANIDHLMKTPWEPWKGKTIAALINRLDMANDSVRYFQLGVNHRKDNKKKYLEVHP